MLLQLTRYLTDNQDRNQTGFVRGMGTHVNLRLLIEKICTSKCKDGLCCVLIDYKSAYNAVNREMLYTALVNKRILTADEAGFLERFYKTVSTSTWGTDQHYHFRNGVHQGSPIMNCSLASTWKTL